MSSNTGYASLDSDHELEETSTSSKRLSTTRREIERRTHVAWLPWLVLAAFTNACLLLAMIYGIVSLDEYRHNRVEWLVISWLIFAIPSLIALYLVVAPFPSSLREKRHKLSRRSVSPNYIPIINVLNATLCLITVIAYLYIGALPDWRSAQWNNKVEYRQYLPVPAFAFVFWTSTIGDEYSAADTTKAVDPDYFWECQIANISDPSADRYNCTSSMKWIKADGYSMHIFDPKTLPLQHSTFNDLRSTIWLYTWVKYDSRKTQTGSSASMTNMGGIVYDPSVDLNKTVGCGLLKVATLPVFATNYVSLELTETEDKYDLLDLGGNKSRNGQDCSGLRKAVFGPGGDNQYLQWNYGTSAMARTNLTDCDIKVWGDQAGCPMQVGLSYSSQIVTKALTQPGIDKLTIWLNAGAVVGGVQFFFWFFTIFAQS